jgi:hypothetical protein
VGLLIGFEAKGIQSWIFESGRLRDMTTGSEVLERLVGEDLLHALEACGFKVPRNDGGTVDRAAGTPGLRPITMAAGRLELAVDEAMTAAGLRFRRLWPLIVRERAPGLRFVIHHVEAQGGASLSSELTGLRDELRAKANMPWVEPIPSGPLALRAQRTGGVAVSTNDRDDPEGPEAVDASLRQRNRTYRKLARRLPIEEKIKKGSRARADRLSFANEMTELTGGRPNRSIAVIHADGTGIGKLLMKFNRGLERIEGLPDGERLAFQSRLSQTLDWITQDAARATLDALLENHQEPGKLALRAVVLGGDDLTMLLPAGIAMDFARRFMAEFDRKSEVELAAFRDSPSSHAAKLDPPARFTVGVGIAFVQAHYPARVAYQLSEALCKHAKRPSRGREAVSALAFHRVTASAIEEYDDILTRELTARGNPPLRLTMGPYSLRNGENGLYGIDRLTTLVDALHGLPSGPQRELISLCHEDRIKAKDRFRRLCEIGDKNYPDRMRTFLDALAAFGCDDGTFWRTGEDMAVTALNDAAALLALRREVNREIPGRETAA